MKKAIFRKTGLILLLAMFAISSMLTGCGQSAEQPSASAEQSVAETQEVAASTEVTEPVTITYWRHQTPTIEELTKQQIEAFKAVEPNITVNFESVGIDDYDKKLNIAIASDSAPDLYAIYDVKFETFYNNGVLAPVDPAAFGYDSVDNMLSESFLEGTMDFAVKDGKLYSGGWAETANWALMYNKDMFDKAGVEYPSSEVPMTWDEYFTLSKNLTLRDDEGKMIQMGDGIFMGAMDNPDGARYILDPIFRQLGGVAFDEVTGEPLDKDRWLKVAQIMYDSSLNGKYGYMDAGFPVESNPHVEVFAGRIAMVTAGVWGESWGLSVNPDLRIGFAPYPQFDDEHNAATTGGWVFAMNAKSSLEELAAANKFLAFITNDENVIKQYDVTGLYVPRNVEGYKEHLLEVTPSMDVFFRDVPRAVMTIYGEKGAERWTVLKKMAENIFKNGATPEEAVETAWQEMLSLQ